MAKRGKKAEVLTQEEKDLRRFRHFFLRDYRAESKFRVEAEKCGEYYDGNQWTEEEKQTLKDRGQPDVTINRIKPRIDSILGIQQALRVDTKAYPGRDREQESEAVSEKLREIEDANDFDELETKVFKSQIVAGRGWFKVKKEWDGLDNRYRIERKDYRDVVVDMYSREPDLSDAKQVSETVMTELEDAIDLFPEYEEKLRACVDEGKMLGYAQDKVHVNIQGDQYKSGESLEYQDFNDFVDRERERVRLVTTYYRNLKARKFFFSPGEDPIDVTEMDSKSLETLQQAKPEGKVETQHKRTLNSVTFCWNCILEHKKDIRPHDGDAKFPLIPSQGYQEFKTGQPYSLIRQMIDPQNEVNKRRSKLLHMLSVNQIRFEEGAFENEGEARRQFMRPDGWIKQRKEFQVVVDNNLDVAMSHFNLLNQATQEIDNAAAGKELEGRSNSSSGREFQLRQQQATQPIREMFSNLRAARRRVALYLLDDILKDYPELNLTKYEVVIEEAPESLNLNSETFEQLVSLANNAKVPVPMDMLIKVAPLSGSIKKEFIERLQQQQEQQMQMMQMQAQMAAMGGQPPQGA
jgi:hypothetical protein